MWHEPLDDDQIDLHLWDTSEVSGEERLILMHREHAGLIRRKHGITLRFQLEPTDLDPAIVASDTARVEWTYADGQTDRWIGPKRHISTFFSAFAIGLGVGTGKRAFAA